MRPLFLILIAASFLLAPSATGADDKKKDGSQSVGNARWLFESWQYEKAIYAYKKLIEESSTYASGAEAHVRIGECLHHLKRYTEAIKWFEIAYRNYPKGSGRYAPLIKSGDTYVKLGKVNMARKEYKKFRKQFPQFNFDFEKRINRLLGKQDSSKKQNKSKDEVKVIDDAKILFEFWQYEKALGAYKNLVKHAIGAEAHVRIGECYYHLQQYNEALKWFTVAHRNYPSGGPRHAAAIKLGDTYAKLGQLAVARKSYERARDEIDEYYIDVEKRIKRLTQKPGENTVESKK